MVIVKRKKMKRLLGGPGTITGLMLRLGQYAFGSASIAVMVTAFGFSSYTAFWYSYLCPFYFLIFGFQCIDFLLSFMLCLKNMADYVY